MRDTPSCAIITFNASGTVRSANAATAAIFGHPCETLIGRNVDLLLPNEGRAHHHGHRSLRLNSGTALDVGSGREFEGRRADGTLFPMHLSVCGFVIGGRRRFTGVIHHLSERDLTGRALRQAQKLETVSQLSLGIAHDFNNLLTIIGCNLELLDKQLDVDSHLPRNLLSDAFAAVERGAALTARLLAFGEREPVTPEVIAPSRLIPDLMSLLERALGESTTVRAAIAPDVFTVQADKSRFENAIVNLSINARDAMPGGGTLVLEVANERIDGARAPPHPELEPGNYVRVSVLDEGHGMTASVAKRVFEPYYTTKQPGHGTGLGLSMVFDFVHSAGGQIVVTSEPGAGTRFDLYLPSHESRHLCNASPFPAAR